MGAVRLDLRAQRAGRRSRGDQPSKRSGRGAPRRRVDDQAAGDPVRRAVRRLVLGDRRDPRAGAGRGHRRGRGGRPLAAVRPGGRAGVLPAVRARVLERGLRDPVAAGVEPVVDRPGGRRAGGLHPRRCRLPRPAHAQARRLRHHGRPVHDHRPGHRARPVTAPPDPRSGGVEPGVLHVHDPDARALRVRGVHLPHPAAR